LFLGLPFAENVNMPEAVPVLSEPSRVPLVPQGSQRSHIKPIPVKQRYQLSQFRIAWLFSQCDVKIP